MKKGFIFQRDYLTNHINSPDQRMEYLNMHQWKIDHSGYVVDVESGEHVQFSSYFSQDDGSNSNYVVSLQFINGFYYYPGYGGVLIGASVEAALAGRNDVLIDRPGRAFAFSDSVEMVDYLDESSDQTMAAANVSSGAQMAAVDGTEAVVVDSSDEPISAIDVSVVLAQSLEVVAEMQDCIPADSSPSVSEVDLVFDFNTSGPEVAVADIAFLEGLATVPSPNLVLESEMAQFA